MEKLESAAAGFTKQNSLLYPSLRFTYPKYSRLYYCFLIADLVYLLKRAAITMHVQIWPIHSLLFTKFTSHKMWCFYLQTDGLYIYPEHRRLSICVFSHCIIAVNSASYLLQHPSSTDFLQLQMMLCLNHITVFSVFWVSLFIRFFLSVFVLQRDIFGSLKLGTKSKTF